MASFAMETGLFFVLLAMLGACTYGVQAARVDVPCSRCTHHNQLVNILPLGCGEQVRRSMAEPQNATFDQLQSMMALAIASDSPDQSNTSASTTDNKNNEERPDAAPQSPGMAIRVDVNLVQLRVVVRDAAGNPVEKLKREDFRVYDRGKLQSITAFGVETPESRRARGQPVREAPSVDGMSADSEKPSIPDRFVALVFDDTHLSMQDAVNAQKTARRFLQTLPETDRVGIFSTSGQLTQEFTDSPRTLQKVLSSILPRPLALNNTRDCPNVTYSMADRIENGSDSQSMDAVLYETLQCAFGGNPQKLRYAQPMALEAIHQALRAGEADNQFTFRHLEDALRHLAGMPGDRILVLVSPGFFLARQSLDDAGIVEQANRANIVINTLDVRGLYVPDGMEDISKRPTDSVETGDIKSLDRMDAQRQQSTVLADFAYGTGGTFFHNSNDLDSGLGMAGRTPSISYVLGFAPQNLKPDGTYHTIEVALTGKQKYSIQARRGYFAPRKMSAEEHERQEIAEAIYSGEEMGDLLLQFEAQPFAKSKATGFNIVSQIAVKKVHFLEADNKKADVLRVITTVFDNNGNLVTGGEKVLTMKLDPTQFERLSQKGLTVQLIVALKPGKYLLRQVVWDSAGGQITARNRPVEMLSGIEHRTP